MAGMQNYSLSDIRMTGCLTCEMTGCCLTCKMTGCLTCKMAGCLTCEMTGCLTCDRSSDVRDEHGLSAGGEEDDVVLV